MTSDCAHGGSTTLIADDLEEINPCHVRACNRGQRRRFAVEADTDDVFEEFFNASVRHLRLVELIVEQTNASVMDSV